MDRKSIIGHNIRQRREKARFTQRELAARLSVSVLTVRRWEQAVDEQKTVPRLDVAADLCEVLRCKLNDLLKPIP